MAAAASTDDDVILIETKEEVIEIDSSSEDLMEESSTTKAMECPICLQTCIHPAKLPCGHIFCFLCVKGVAYKNRRCAMCRREIPPEFLDHPQLVNGVQDLFKSKPTEDGYQWFYEGRNGWWQYDERTSQDIEEAFKKGEKSCTILVAGYVYVVDFEAMLQQRQNDPSRRRHVKRDLETIPKKGVAGLRINDDTDDTSSSNNHTDTTSDSITVPSPESQLLHDHNYHIVNTNSNNNSTNQNNINSSSLRSNNFISTIAATDAAIRIASDIIGSTLAHADELATRSEELEQSNSSSNCNDSTSSTTTTNNSNQNIDDSREFLQETEELLEATQAANIATTSDPIKILSPPDLFMQTLEDFRSLTLRNVIDTSDSDDDDAGNEQIIL